MIARSIYIMVIHKDGSNHTEERRVWDAERFILALDQVLGGDGIKVVITAEAEYRRSRCRNRK